MLARPNQPLDVPLMLELCRDRETRRRNYFTHAPVRMRILGVQRYSCEKLLADSLYLVGKSVFWGFVLVCVQCYCVNVNMCA